MTNIIQFSRQVQVSEGLPEKAPEPVKRPTAAGVGGVVLNGVWGVTVLLWPILQWILSLDCVYQLVRMLYYWNTPGVYAGWTFLLHFSVFTALMYFVAFYNPKGHGSSARVKPKFSR